MHEEGIIGLIKPEWGGAQCFDARALSTRNAAGSDYGTAVAGGWGSPSGSWSALSACSGDIGCTCRIRRPSSLLDSGSIV